jgi:type II secretory pathway pseudopilin PulG
MKKNAAMLTNKGKPFGFSYIEVLVAVVIITISLVPAIDALTTGMKGVAISQELTVQHYHLLAKIEEVLAQPYNSLQSAATTAGSPTILTSYSDALATPDRRLVFLSNYDANNADADNDPFTGTDSNILWVRVEVENTAQFFESLISN